MTTLYSKIDEKVKEIVEREHKYHTTDYDGVVGVTKEDISAILKEVYEEVVKSLENNYEDLSDHTMLSVAEFKSNLKELIGEQE